MKVVTLVGDSHVLFLRRYIRLEGLPVRYKTCSGELLLSQFFAPTESGEIDWTTPQVKETYGDPLRPDDGPIGISFGSALSVLAWDPMWRTYSPWRLAAELGLRPLSDHLLCKLIREQAAPALAFMDAVVAAGIRALIVQPPPLKRLHPAIQAGTAPPVLRELDTVWRRQMRAEYEQRGLPSVEAPQEAYDTDGFLKDEYDCEVGSDPHHANTAYAALIVPQIMRLADRLEGGALTDQPMRE